MECLFLFISSERENNIIYEELIDAADELKSVNQKLLKPILKSLSLKPSFDNEELFCDSEVNEFNHDWEGQIPIIGCEFQETRDEFYYNDYFRLAEQLHKICDEDITVGQTNVQIIWCVDKYAPCPSDVPEFYGAIERMKLWHNCSFNVVTKNESNLLEWSLVFPFQMVTSSKNIVTNSMNTIWAGRLGIKLEHNNSLTEIGDVCLQAKSYDNSRTKFNMLSDSYVSQVAEIFEDIDISSIPWPCIIPGSICQLTISHSTEQDGKNALENLFAKITNRTGVGSLLRIRYSDQPPTLMHPSSVNTSSWKQTIADGQFTVTPSLEFKGYHRVQVFLLTSEGSSDQEIYAIGLQDMNSCGEEVMKVALHESANQMENINAEPLEDESKTEKCKKNVLDLLTDTPELTPVHMAAMSHLLVHIPINLRNCFKKNGTNINNLWTETKEELEYLTNSQIFSHIFMTRPPKCVVSSPNTVFEAEINAPKECWPEYQALKDTKNVDLNISTGSQNLLKTIPVIPEGAPVYFKADQLLKFFSNTGEPSESIKTKLVKFSPKGKNRFTRAFQPFNEIKKTNWPESLLSNYHGINYNTCYDQEAFDTTCSEMKNQWVVEETNSTCSSFQTESKYSWKKSLNRQKGTVEGDQKSSRSGSSFHTNTQCPVVQNRMLRRSLSIKRPRSPAEFDQMSSRSGSSFYTNNQYPMSQNRLLRRSPRKKVRQDTERSLLKASDLLKLENIVGDRSNRTRTSLRKPVSSDLSELHTRKLRNAVLTALESENITVNSSIFKNCFKKLFAVCKPFVADVIGLGSTTRNMEKIARSHVKQVIEFEQLKMK